MPPVLAVFEDRQLTKAVSSHIQEDLLNLLLDNVVIIQQPVSGRGDFPLPTHIICSLGINPGDEL